MFGVKVPLLSEMLLLKVLLMLRVILSRRFMVMMPRPIIWGVCPKSWSSIGLGKTWFDAYAQNTYDTDTIVIRGVLLFSLRLITISCL